VAELAALWSRMPQLPPTRPGCRSTALRHFRQSSDGKLGIKTPPGPPLAGRRAVPSSPYLIGLLCGTLDPVAQDRTFDKRPSASASIPRDSRAAT